MRLVFRQLTGRENLQSHETPLGESVSQATPPSTLSKIRKVHLSPAQPQIKESSHCEKCIQAHHSELDREKEKRRNISEKGKEI